MKRFPAFFLDSPKGSYHKDTAHHSENQCSRGVPGDRPLFICVVVFFGCTLSNLFVMYQCSRQSIEKADRKLVSASVPKSFVNMEKIVSYSADSIKVVNGDKLILAQKKYNDFIRQYMKYAKDGGIVNV